MARGIGVSGDSVSWKGDGGYGDWGNVKKILREGVYCDLSE